MASSGSPKILTPGVKSKISQSGDRDAIQSADCWTGGVGSADLLARNTPMTGCIIVNGATLPLGQVDVDGMMKLRIGRKSAQVWEDS